MALHRIGEVDRFDNLSLCRIYVVQCCVLTSGYQRLRISLTTATRVKGKGLLQLEGPFESLLNHTGLMQPLDKTYLKPQKTAVPKAQLKQPDDPCSNVM